jgi:gliding motility-associated-like protein
MIYTYPKNLLHRIFYLFFCLLSFGVFAQPSNDNCTGSISITPDSACTSVSGDFALSTKSTLTPANSFYDIWYSFTAKTTTHYISVTGSGDLKVGIQLYSGTCGTLTAVGSAITSTTPTINVTIPSLTVGTTYYYRVYHTVSNTLPTATSISTCVENFIQNDNCTGAYTLTPGNPGETAFPTNGKTAGATQSMVACKGTADDDVWYKFKATNKIHFVSVTGSTSFDGVVQLFSGSCASLTSLDCQDATNNGQLETASNTNLTIGNWYYVRVFHSANTSSTTPYFSISVNTPPSNDDCGGATLMKLGTTCTQTFGDGSYATQSLVAATGKGTANDDLWYKFVADTTIAFISVYPSSDYDPVVQVFSGCSATPTPLAPAFYDDASYGKGNFGNAIVTGLIKGNTYYYRVYDAASTNPVTMTFNTCVVNPVTNNDCAKATKITPGYTCTLTAGDGTFTTQSLAATGGVGNANDDVWYKFTATNTSHFISVNASLLYDPVVQVFSTCSATPTPLAPAFNNDNDYDPATTGTAKVSGLTIGNTYYYRVFDKNAANPITMTFSTCVAIPPVNDDCAGSLVVLPSGTCNSVSSNGMYASESLATNCTGDANDDVWFKFIAQSPSQFISVTPNDALYDPIVEVFSACSATPTKLAPAFCNDALYTKGVFGTGLVNGLTTGNTYYYRVFDKAATSQDTMSFSTCVVNAVPNDECAGALSVTPGTTCSPIDGDGMYATQSLVQCAGNVGAANDDVWFKFVASKPIQFISVTPNDSKYDPVVQVYSNCAANPTSISCNDVYPTGSFGTVGLTGLTAGNTYYYRVYDKNTTNQDTMSFTTCVVEQITNDDCSNAISITPSASYSPSTGDGTYTTTSLAGCVGSANDDVWYKFTAASTKEFITVEAPKGYDPVVQVFSACGTPLAATFCNNNAYPISSFGTTSLATTIGTTYYYRIYDNAATNTYPMQFKTAITHAPVNDECAGAINQTIDGAVVSGDGSFASQTITAGTCGGTANDDVWYKFTATAASHTIYVNSSTDYDPVVQLYSNCSATPTPFPSAAGSCDDARFPQNGSGSKTYSGLAVGTTYYYRVYDSGSTTPSTMTFTTNVTLPPTAPSNDDPCKAIYITAATSCNYTTYTNDAATGSVGAPAPGCGTYSGGDVWFKTKVPFSGELTIDTKELTIIDGGMAIYSGKCGALSLITCDDDGGTGTMPKIHKQGLNPGDTIWIRIWENGNNNNGTFGLCITKPAEAPLVGTCTNTDFSSGLTGWFGTTGDVNKSSAGSAAPDYVPTTSNVTPPAMFSLKTTGIDPICGFPMVCPGYATSILLGDATTVSSPHGATFEQYFPVTPSNAFFIYNYAAVLQNGGHGSEEQPFFKVELFDDDGNQISCGDYLVAAPKTGYGDNIGFQKAPNKTDVIYKSWTKVGINLNPYVGKNVHVRFTSGDCAQGGHYGYVYLSFACAPFEIIKPASVCLGDTATLYAPKGAISYSWVNSTTRAEVSTSDSLVYVPTVAGVIPFTCFVTMFGTSLCTDSLTTTITVGATPTLTITDPAPKCKLDSINLTLTGITTGSTPNLSYSYWKDNLATIPLTNQTAIKSSGTYYIKGEKSATCKDIKPVNVVFNPLPTAKISGTVSVCKNDPAPDITIKGDSSTAPYTFTYNIGGGTNKTIVSTGNTATISVPTSTKGTYTYNLVSVKDASATTCSQNQTGSATVTVNDITTQTITCGTKTTSSVQFKWNDNTAATSYTYSYTTDKGNSGNGTFTAGTIQTVINGLTLNEKVDITITPVGDLCGKVFTGSCTTLNCNSPTVDSKTPIVQCNNTTINAITYTSTPVGGKIHWKNGFIPTPKIGQIDSATGIFTSFTAINTTYAPILDTIFVTATDISCTGPATEHYITINPDAHVNDITDISVCTGDNTSDIYFTTNNTGGTNTYTWTNDTPSIGLAASGTGDILGFTTTNTTASPIVATITVTPHFTNDGITCAGPSKTFKITVNPLPTINAGNDTSICKGKSLKLKGTGGVSYIWDNGVTDNTSFTPSATQTYTVTGTDVNGCKNTDQVVVTINQLPLVKAGNDTTICSGTLATLKGSGALSYTWDNGISDNVGFSPTTKLTYTVTGTDINGCINTDNVDVSINQPPKVDGGKDQSVCVGSSITLKASGASTYSWDNGVSDNVAFTPASSQTYIVTGTDLAGCINKDTVDVTINTLPLVKAGNDTTVCQGFDVELKASGALTYQWDNGVIDRILFKANANQKYVVIGTDANGCINKDSLLVNVNTAPIVKAGNDTSICFGFPVTLSSRGNALTYTWDNGVTDNVAFSPSLTKKYVLTGKDAINCTNTDTIEITVNSLPLVNAGNDTSICINNTAIVKASGAKTYVWDNGVTDRTSFTPLTSKQYVVIGTDVHGCVNKDSLLLTVNNLPIITAGNDTTVCQGFDVILKGKGGLSYQWDNGITDKVLFKANANKKYVVIGKDINGCINKDSLLVNVNSAPIINAGNDTSICLGFPVTLSSKGNALTYTWDNGISDNVSFSPFVSKKYVLTGKDNINCTNTDTIEVIVNSLPLVKAGNDTSICIGKTAIVKASGAKTYVWDNGITDRMSFNPLVTKQYLVIGTDINGCVNKDSLTVTINTLPIISAGTDTIICKGNTFLLKGSGGISYTWDNLVSDNILFTPTTSKQYKVIGTDIHGCQNKDSVIVSIANLPSITMVEVCETKKVILSATNTPRTINPWESADGTIATINGTTGEVTGVKGGQSLITYTDINGCTDSKTITINANPSILNTPFEVCVKSKVTATSNHKGAVVTPWSTSNGNATINSATGEILGVSEGKSDITFIDTKGCQVTKVLTINGLPVVNFKSETSICIDDSLYMNDLTVPASVTATWSYGDGVKTTNLTHKYHIGGQYSITLTSTSTNGCKDSLTKINYVEVVPKPTVAFTFTPDSIDIFDPVVTFTNQSNAVHYKWVFGDEKPISTATNPNHIFPSTTGQHYLVTLTGYNTATGCDTSYTQKIVSKEPLIYYIPNTFTPNGDEVNNTFKPVFFSGLDIYNYHLSIYNRWGELIFESENVDYGWDGTYGNQLVETATYVWKIEFKEKLVDKRHVGTGHINVIK